jgi:chromosome partitioning protein
MSNIIAICNQKGGVGKTTTAMNLGAALAKQGKRVLLCDLDAQANLSEYLGFEEDDKPTITELFAVVAAQAYIDADTVKSSIRHNELNGVDYIPANINLANADVFLLNALRRETVLKRILTEDVTKDYDYVLIDCLPSLGVLLLNALAAADSILIPVQVQKFSIDRKQGFLSAPSSGYLITFPIRKRSCRKPCLSMNSKAIRGAKNISASSLIR